MSKEYNIEIKQGQDHEITLNFENFPLSGYTIAEMQVRKTCSSPEKELDYSIAGGQLTVDDVANKIIIRVSEGDSFLISNNSVYDLFIENPSIPKRKKVIHGKITIECAVTRD